MIKPHPRSVLRPEYLEQTPSTVLPNRFTNHHSSNKWVNTNTAPIYESHNKFEQKCKPVRRQSHPYIRHARNLVSRSLVCNSAASHYSPHIDHPAHRISLTTVTTSASDMCYYSPSISQFSRSNSVTCGYLQSRPPTSPRKSREEYSSRTFTHGQAEQLRRSRESNTFAKIDSLLSTPPLNQVREMYLQNRSNCGGSNSSAARTTKKANLSVVHTVVRFRIRDHLIHAQEHLKRLLDTLFRKTVSNYDTNMRDSLTAQKFGIPRLPCPPTCPYCSDFAEYSSHCRKTPRIDYDRIDNRERVHTCTNYISESDSVTSTKLGSLSAVNNISDVEDTNKTVSDRCHFDSCEPTELTIHEPSFITEPLKMSPVKINFLETTLPSIHLGNENGQPCSKRSRLDSSTLRLVMNDFDHGDWMGEGINLGPFSDEPVDLHALVSEPLQMKQEDFCLDNPLDTSEWLGPLSYDRSSIPLLAPLL